jgi:hypothetical protein
LISSSSVVRQLCGEGTAISGDAWFGIWGDDRDRTGGVKAELFKVIHRLFTTGAGHITQNGKILADVIAMPAPTELVIGTSATADATEMAHTEFPPQDRWSSIS